MTIYQIKRNGKPLSFATSETKARAKITVFLKMDSDSTRKEYSVSALDIDTRKVALVGFLTRLVGSEV